MHSVFFFSSIFLIPYKTIWGFHIPNAKHDYFKIFLNVFSANQHSSDIHVFHITDKMNCWFNRYGSWLKHKNYMMHRLYIQAWSSVFFSKSCFIVEMLLAKKKLSHLNSHSCSGYLNFSFCSVSVVAFLFICLFVKQLYQLPIVRNTMLCIHLGCAKRLQSRLRKTLFKIATNLSPFYCVKLQCNNWIPTNFDLMRTECKQN